MQHLNVSLVVSGRSTGVSGVLSESPLWFLETSWNFSGGCIEVEISGRLCYTLFHSWATSLPDYTSKVCEVRGVLLMAKFNLWFEILTKANFFSSGLQLLTVRWTLCESRNLLLKILDPPLVVPNASLQYNHISQRGRGSQHSHYCSTRKQSLTDFL